MIGQDALQQWAQALQVSNAVPARSNDENAARLLAFLKLWRSADGTSGEQSFQALIDQVPDYLWVKDVNGRFIVANKALAADSGRADARDMIGLTDFDLHSPEAAQCFFEVEQRIVHSGKPVVDLEESIIDASGAVKWLSSTKMPMRNDRDEVVGLVGVARDITERKRAEMLREGETQILEMIATSAPLEQVLDRLMRLIEAETAGVHASILLLEGERLRSVPSPSLPSALLEAADGVRIGP
ncbi:MAG TPA: GGDEF and EAL domain-containing protein, partial [Roseiarcus sp.]|nr:GGDEF and EAL domain-containing protein [Roseiarcus sp.]